mgnify:CR=1 FL=1
MDRNKALCVSYRAIEWDAAAKSHLGLIAGETDAGLAHYEAAINNGEMSLMAVDFEGQRVGSLSYMLDHDLCGKVLFVTGMGAHPVEGVSLAQDACARFLPELAKEKDCAAIRFWTRREGFVKALEQEGYAPIYVMEKAVV